MYLSALKWYLSKWYIRFLKQFIAVLGAVADPICWKQETQSWHWFLICDWELTGECDWPKYDLPPKEPLCAHPGLAHEPSEGQEALAARRELVLAAPGRVFYVIHLHCISITSEWKKCMFWKNYTWHRCHTGSQNTACWHQNKNSAAVGASHTKAELVFQCQQKPVLDQMDHPVLTLWLCRSTGHCCTWRQRDRIPRRSYRRGSGLWGNVITRLGICDSRVCVNQGASLRSTLLEWAGKCKFAPRFTHT